MDIIIFILSAIIAYEIVASVLYIPKGRPGYRRRRRYRL